MHSLITPLLLITCAVISGITFIHCSLSLSIPLVYSALLLYGAWYAQAQRTTWFTLILTLAAFIAGACRFAVITHRYHTASTLLQTAPCTLTGTIVDKSPGTFTTKKDILTLQLQKIVSTTGCYTYLPHTFFITLTTSHNSCFQVDDSVSITLTQPLTPATGSFAFYLQRQSVLAYVFVQHNAIKLLNRPHYSCNRWLCTKRNELITTISHKVSPEAYTLLSCLFFGRKDGDEAMYAQLQHLFKLWGISHYLARSGLHVALFIMLLNALLMLLFLGYIARIVLLLCAVSIYFFFSWPTLSFIRAVLMFIVVHVYAFNYKRIKITHITLLVALATLLYNPYHLFFLDFQLTFTLTYLLALISEQRLFSKLLRP